MADALDVHEEQDAIARAKRGDCEAMERLIEAARPLIIRLAGRLGTAASLRDELIQAGVIGLIQAVRRFAPEQGTRLTTYAVPWMLGEMKRALRSALDATGALEKRSEMLRCEASLREQLGRAPRLEEVAGACGMDAHQAAQLEVMAGTPLSMEGSDGEALLRTLAGEEDIDVERVALRMAMNELEAEEQRVVLLRYYRDMTQQETARLLGSSQAQISRIERRALDRLRTLLA